MRSPRQILAEQARVSRLLMESRVDFLRQNYVPKLQAFIDDRDAFENSVRFLEPGQRTALLTNPGEVGFDANKVFDYILGFDPNRTKSNSQWLLNLVLRRELKIEDVYKAEQYLADFERVKSRMPVEQRDILRYKSLQDLYDNIEPFKQMVTQGEKDRALDVEMHGQAEVLMNTSEYKIVIPKTKAASCYFGRNTQWCTAASGMNYFDSYSRQGPLYIVLHKPTNRRWQFHFATSQFMNENDRPINLEEFAREHPAISQFFAQRFEAEFTSVSRYGPYTFGWKEPVRELHVYIGHGLGSRIKTLYGFTPERVITRIDHTTRVTDGDEAYRNGLIEVLNEQRLVGNSMDFLDRGIGYSVEEKRHGLIKDIGKLVVPLSGLKWPKAGWFRYEAKVQRMNQGNYGYGDYSSFETTYFSLGALDRASDECWLSMTVEGSRADEENNLIIREGARFKKEDSTWCAEAFAKLVPFLDTEWKLQHRDCDFIPFDFLKEDKIRAIADSHPLLCRVGDVFKAKGDCKQVRDMVLGKIEENEAGTYNDNDWTPFGLRVFTWNSISDFIDDVGNDGAKFVAKLENGEERISFYDVGGVDRDNMRDMLEGLDADDLRKLGEWLHFQHPDEVNDIFGDDTEEGEYDPTDIDHILELQGEVDNSELESCFEQAKRQGMESGAEGEAFKDLWKALAEVPNCFYQQHEGNEWKGGPEAWDKPVMLCVPFEDLVKHCDEEDPFYTAANESWWKFLEIECEVNEPQYGWGDIDEDTMKERFGELLYEDGILESTTTVR